VRRMVARTFDRNITLAVHKGSEPLWVNAEPSYLEQALLNLCINARDAMPQGGTLTLEAGAVDLEAQHPDLGATCAPGRYAGISVQDTGAGIAPETLPRVFDPFFTTKAPDRGTGLGLAMVYGFVENHDGFVKVKSEPGHGARFTISLPLISAPAEQTGHEGSAQIQPGRGTVLVVDDEPLVRAFALEGLKGLGYQVLVAENGKQALQMFEQHRKEIDCVLLDLIMPEVSGLETYRRMRAVDPLVKVIFASGYSTGQILRDAPDARSAAFLGKPFTLEGLSIALRKSGMDQPYCG
jgi:two-component system cell cycle sensor histidine kinase/response regulator CckA